jgi:hypothetical protein
MFRLRFASPYFVLRPRFNQLLAINPTLTFFFVFFSVSYFVHPTPDGMKIRQVCLNFILQKNPPILGGRGDKGMMEKFNEPTLRR